MVSEPEWESVRISGKVTGGSSWRGYTVQYIISNRGISGNFKCGSEGSYSIELEKVLLTDKIYFYYDGQNYWHCEKSVGDLKENGNIEMTKDSNGFPSIM